MKKNNYLFLFLITLMLSCNTKEYDLGGEWCKIDLPINNHAPPPLFHPAFGIGFSGDKIEYLNGFIRYEKDGQLFKFSFGNRKSITYDLGCNFVERNFDASDFEKKTEYD